MRAALTLDDATLNPQPKKGRPKTTAVDCFRCGDARVVLLRLVFALPAICSIGCATGRYSAADLPPEFEAPRVANPQTLDLSKIAMASASDELIARGDVLEISIITGLSLPQPPWLVRVDNNGNANLPIIGSVPVAGLDMETAESQIKLAGVGRQIYRIPPHVTVTRKQQQKNRVLVIGAVQVPGRYELPSRSSDLLTAIYAAGGLAEDAGTEVTIQYPGGLDNRVRQAVPIAGGSPEGLSAVGHSSQEAPRAGPRSVRINLVSATKSGTGGYYVEDGGIVVVEKCDPMQVTVMGLVKKPGTYEFPVTQEIRVSQAISEAEGVSSMLGDKIFVRRRLPHLDGEKVIQVSLSAMNKDGGRSDLRLAPGDIVSVEQTAGTVFMDVLKIIRVGISAGGAIF